MEKDKQKQKPKQKQPQQDSQNTNAVEQLLKEKDKQIAEYENRIEKMKFDNMLDEKLSGSRAKNKTAVRALLDMDKISVVEGRLIGADEQISAVKQKDSYLFESATTGGGANPVGVKQNVDMDSLSDEEYFKIKLRRNN